MRSVGHEERTRQIVLGEMRNAIMTYEIMAAWVVLRHISFTGGGGLRIPSAGSRISTSTRQGDLT
jgi:hypothetical protein